MRPITRPPIEVPNQASALASDGTERVPPRSAAIALRPTAGIHSPPNERDISTTETVATTQEVRVSMLVGVNMASRQNEAAKIGCSPHRAKRNAGPAPHGCPRISLALHPGYGPSSAEPGFEPRI